MASRTMSTSPLSYLEPTTRPVNSNDRIDQAPRLRYFQTMSSRSVTAEMLRRRRDIPDSEVEALVERAAILQEQDGNHADAHATAEEIAAVASELDIDPRYVEQAISVWRTEKSKGPMNPPGERILARH